MGTQVLPLETINDRELQIIFFGWTSELQYRTTLILFRWLISLSKITNVYHTFIIMQPVNHTLNAKDIP
jgi:hypothetical protein